MVAVEVAEGEEEAEGDMPKVGSHRDQELLCQSDYMTL